jgi:hypothetical protein
MASREYQHLQKKVDKLQYDLNNLVLALFELKILKVKTDEDGKPVINTGKDEQPEVQ